MPCLLRHPFKVNCAIFPARHPKIAAVFGRLQCLQPWPDGVWRQGLESWREFPSARWVRDGTQNGSVHCSGFQGHSEQGGDDEQKRLDPRAQMEDLNTDAVTSLLIKFMSSAYLFHWQRIIIYLAIDVVMNNRVVYK